MFVFSPRHRDRYVEVRTGFLNRPDRSVFHPAFILNALLRLENCNSNGFMYYFHSAMYISPLYSRVTSSSSSHPRTNVTIVEIGDLGSMCVCVFVIYDL